MYVPNFVPEPREVPNNVAQERVAVRLAFMWRTIALHLASVGIVAGLSRLPWPSGPVLGPAIATLGLLAAMELMRIRLRGRSQEPLATAPLFLILIPVLAWTIALAERAGMPVWILGAAALTVPVYAGLARRDYSYVGGGAFGIAVVAALAFWLDPQPWLAFWIGAAYVTFLQYDGASLLSRRRVGEEAGAVMDLYRDVLNLFGYVPRVVKHWRRHRIWGEKPFGLDLPRWAFGEEER